MKDAPIAINGWTIYAHPLFLDQFEDFVRAEACGEVPGCRYESCFRGGQFGFEPTKIVARPRMTP